MIFHKSGPLAGQARGYAFVTYREVSVNGIFLACLNIVNNALSTHFIQSSGATVALHKLNGILIGTKNVVVRLAKNINYVRICV